MTPDCGGTLRIHLDICAQCARYVPGGKRVPVVADAPLIGAAACMDFELRPEILAEWLDQLPWGGQ